MTNSVEQAIWARFPTIEADLIDIFKDGNIETDEDTARGLFFCTGKNIDGLDLNFNIIIGTESLMFRISDEEINDIIYFELNRIVDGVTRSQNIENNEDFFTVTHDFRIEPIKIYFKPNYSIELPRLWLSRYNQIFPDMHSLDCDFDGLNELLDKSETIDKKGNYLYQSSNEEGFTFKMSVNPEGLSCSLELWYNKYTRPIYTASFSGVLEIQVYGTNIFLDGQFDDVFVTVYTAQNFALSNLKGRIWRLPVPWIKDPSAPMVIDPATTIINYFFDIEDNLLEIFRHGNTYIDDFEQELGRIHCSIEDNCGIKARCDVLIIEQTLQFAMWHVKSQTKIIYCNMLHSVSHAPRTKNSDTNEDYFTIIRDQEELPPIKIYFKPNYSVELPQLWLSKKNTIAPETHTINCDFVKLDELLGQSQTIDPTGNHSFHTSDNNGFSFSMSINPQALSCSLKLCYEKYTRPVYTASFAGVTKITTNGPKIILDGLYEDAAITIFTDANFAMSELERWIWAQ